MQLKISIKGKHRIVHCPRWQIGPFGSTIPVGDTTLDVCAKCFYYKKLKDIFTLECSWGEDKDKSSME